MLVFCGHIQLSRYVCRCAIFVVSAILVACATPPVEVEAPAPTLEPLLSINELAVSTVILVSDNIPAYTDVAEKLSAKLKTTVPVYYLDGDPIHTAEVLGAVQRVPHSFVIAIGLDAAVAARKLNGKRVVFCQVFNYHTLRLEVPWMKGVSALPPSHLQFRAWKAVDPKLTHIGVITGPGFDEILKEARIAARRYGLQLTHQQVKSDKEMLYAFKRMSPKIQGLWLLPDNRILSRAALREIMSSSLGQGKQVAAFNSELLMLGAMLGFESDPADVAERVLDRLRRAGSGTGLAGDMIVPLERIKVHSNSAVIKQLGLKAAASIGEASHVS